MNKEERIVKQHLKSLGFTDIIYEPDGNIPPDFLIDNKVAVEVRRLNQHYNGNAIEDVEYKLIPKINELCHNFKTFGHSSFVSIWYKRPIKINKKLINNVKKTLEEHLPYITEQKKYKICENLKLEFYPGKKKYDYSYMLGMVDDADQSGAILYETLDSLKIIIDEKSKKIEPYFHKYEEWWLALVDYIRIGQYDQDAEEDIRGCFVPPYDNWNKILIISPHLPEYALEFNNNSK